MKKKPKVKIKSNRKEIVAINGKAKEQRLSYGQLVALQYLEEHSQNEKIFRKAKTSHQNGLFFAINPVFFQQIRGKILTI